MKRLIAIVFVMWVGFSLLCAGIVSAGQTQLETRQITGLENCGGMPCYQGIVPLQTSYEDAKGIIARLQGATMRSSDEASISGDPIQSVRYYRSGDGRVRDISLTVRGNAIVLGDVITRLGTPCAVFSFVSTATLPFPSSVNYP